MSARKPKPVKFDLGRDGTIAIAAFRYCLGCDREQWERVRALWDGGAG